MWRALLLGTVLAFVVGAAPGKAPPEGLPSKLRGTIDKVEASFVAGEIEKAARLLAPTIGGLKEDVAAKFDEALVARQLPPAREILVQARLKLLMEDRTSALPAPSVRERLLLLEALQKHVDEPLGQIAAQPLLKEGGELPQNMEEFERRIGEVGELEGKLRLAERCARYAAELAGKLPALARNKLTDPEKELLAKSEGDLGSKVAETARDIRELALETHLQRLRYAVTKLGEPRLTKEKFIAAATTRHDVRALKEALAPPPAPPAKGGKGSGSGKKPAADAPPPTPIAFRRGALSAPGIADDVQKLSEEAEKLGGSLGEKAERLFTGLELWLRGRYGWGPEVGGLAKSDEALKRPELLNQVSMPENLLAPQSASEPRSPNRKSSERKPPDRRHHYTWAWEDRRLLTTTRYDPGYWTDVTGTIDYAKVAPERWGGSGNFVGGSASTLTSQFDRIVRLPPQDPRLVYRIVGFVEYLEALKHLDKFVEEASSAEFEIAEELIRAQDAFRIEINLSRKLEQGSALAERSENPRDDFHRHGLEWMTALARVELGAMLAGFTTHDNPFLGLAPTIYRQERVRTKPFGSDAYGELLLDGLRTHYWSIVQEQVIENDFRSGVPESHLLTYGRRATLGRKFLRAAMQYLGAGDDGKNLPAAQRTELKTWDETFIKLQRMMLYCLTFKVGMEKTMFYRTLAAGKEFRSLATERDQTPDAIRRMLQTMDPTLVGCPCK